MKHYSNTAVQCARLRSRQPLLLNRNGKEEEELREPCEHNIDECEHRDDCESYHIPVSMAFRESGPADPFEMDWAALGAPWLAGMGTDPAPPPKPAPETELPRTIQNAMAKLPPGLEICAGPPGLEIPADTITAVPHEYTRESLLSLGARMRLTAVPTASKSTNVLKSVPAASIPRRPSLASESDEVDSTPSQSGDGTDPVLPVSHMANRPIPAPIGPAPKVGWAVQSAPQDVVQVPECHAPESEWPSLGSAASGKPKSRLRK